MIANASSLDSFPQLVARTWRLARKVLWGGLAVAAFVVLLEAIHLFDILARLHPYIAWTVFGAVGLPLLGWAGYRATVFLRSPEVPTAPDLPAPEAGWGEKDRERFVNHVTRYLRRQEANPNLPEEARRLIPAAIENMNIPLRVQEMADPVVSARVLTDRAEQALKPVLQPLDAAAGRLIRRTAVEVSVATAVSPSVLMDSLITLARNIDMMSRMAGLYYGRPGLRGTLKIMRDVFGSAVAAGALEAVSDHLTGAISEMAGNWSSRLLGPIGQGVVNGVVTMRLGAAARQRCRGINGARISWRTWKVREYTRAAGRLYDWLKEDVGPGIFKPMFGWISGSGQGAERDSKPGFFARLFRRKDTKTELTEEDGRRSPDPLLDSDLME